MSTKPDKHTAHLRAPNHAQLSKAVKGHDPYYRIRPRRAFWWTELSYGIALLIIFSLFIAAAFIIAEAFG